LLLIFFSVMKFVKSNHRATLKNDHCGINSHSCNNVANCPNFGDLKIKQKLNTDNYCTSFNVKLAFFNVLVLTLQIGFAAH